LNKVFSNSLRVVNELKEVIENKTKDENSKTILQEISRKAIYNKNNFIQVNKVFLELSIFQLILDHKNIKKASHNNQSPNKSIRVGFKADSERNLGKKSSFKKFDLNVTSSTNQNISVSINQNKEFLSQSERNVKKKVVLSNTEDIYITKVNILENMNDKQNFEKVNVSVIDPLEINKLDSQTLKENDFSTYNNENLNSERKPKVTFEVKVENLNENSNPNVTSQESKKFFNLDKTLENDSLIIINEKENKFKPQNEISKKEDFDNVIKEELESFILNQKIDSIEENNLKLIPIKETAMVKSFNKNTIKIPNENNTIDTKIETNINSLSHNKNSNNQLESNNEIKIKSFSDVEIKGKNETCMNLNHQNLEVDDQKANTKLINEFQNTINQNINSKDNLLREELNNKKQENSTQLIESKINFNNQECKLSQPNEDAKMNTENKENLNLKDGMNINIHTDNNDDLIDFKMIDQNYQINEDESKNEKKPNNDLYTLTLDEFSNINCKKENIDSKNDIAEITESNSYRDIKVSQNVIKIEENEEKNFNYFTLKRTSTFDEKNLDKDLHLHDNLSIENLIKEKKESEKNISTNNDFNLRNDKFKIKIKQEENPVSQINSERKITNENKFVLTKERGLSQTKKKMKKHFNSLFDNNQSQKTISKKIFDDTNDIFLSNKFLNILNLDNFHNNQDSYGNPSNKDIKDKLFDKNLKVNKNPKLSSNPHRLNNKDLISKIGKDFDKDISSLFLHKSSDVPENPTKNSYTYDKKASKLVKKKIQINDDNVVSNNSNKKTVEKLLMNNQNNRQTDFSLMQNDDILINDNKNIDINLNRKILNINNKNEEIINYHLIQKKMTSENLTRLVLTKNKTLINNSTEKIIKYPANSTNNNSKLLIENDTSKEKNDLNKRLLNDAYSNNLLERGDYSLKVENSIGYNSSNDLSSSNVLFLKNNLINSKNKTQIKSNLSKDVLIKGKLLTNKEKSKESKQYMFKLDIPLLNSNHISKDKIGLKDIIKSNEINLLNL